MKKAVSAICLLALTASLVWSQTSDAPEKMALLVTLSGKEYKDVTITKVEPDGLRISYADGMAKIKFSDLSDELKAKYNYDPEKAKAYAQEVKAQQDAGIASEVKKIETQKAIEQMKKIPGRGLIADVDQIGSNFFTSGVQYVTKTIYTNNSSSMARMGGGGGASVSQRSFTDYDPNSMEIYVSEVNAKELVTGQKWQGQVWDVGVIKIGKVQMKHLTANMESYIKSQYPQ